MDSGLLDVMAFYLLRSSSFGLKGRLVCQMDFELEKMASGLVGWMTGIWVEVRWVYS